jgi:putative transposase
MVRFSYIYGDSASSYGAIFAPLSHLNKPPIERLEVPRDREGEFVTEVFERYKRLTGSMEEAILEMYLSGVSTRKIAGITVALSRVRIAKDTVSRITSRLREQQKTWREIA